MGVSVHLYRMIDVLDPGLKNILMAILEEIERQQKERVTKDEFRELRDIVAALAQEQKGLAEAQRRTEQRLEDLVKSHESLVVAQERTERRVEELAAAQERTEQRVEELAAAQERTEKEVEKLAKGLAETRRMVGGLSDTVGYGLEDRAIAAMPFVLRRRFGMEPEGGFVRRFITIDGKDVELNLYGKAVKEGESWDVVGEGKARLSKRDVDRFVRLLERLRSAGVVGDRVLPLMATYSARPVVQEYAEEKGITVIWSYELVAGDAFV